MSNMIRKMSKQIAVFLVIVLGVSFLLEGWKVYAYEEKSATIKYDIVNIRQEPTTSSAVVSKLAMGKALTIIDERDVSDGYIWYKVTYTVSGTKKSGWVRSDCIIIECEDNDFETYLTQQGFPETYKVKLRALHAIYPEWVFKAQHTGLDWNASLAAQYKLGNSLVPSNSISSWKSVQDGAYDWDTSTWYGLDGSSWVAASEGIIAYYMDPRNFLDETFIFQFLEQSYDEKLQTEKGLKNVIADTFLAGTYKENDGMISYIATLLEAAKLSGVSPYVLASQIILEQGANGTGKSISGTVAGYEGYYNYFNVGAYATSTMTAVERGLWYASGSGKGETSYKRPWNTITKSILGGAVFFGSSYVSEGQDTLYLKKFNVQGKNPYTHQYMTNVLGAATEGQILSKAFHEGIRASNLVFKIPIYDNMPANACAKPTGTGSPNYMLKSLKVSGYNLTPTFDKYVSNYSLIVPYETSSITIVATKVDSKATVSGAGSKNLKVGKNQFKITVKAENGATKTYTLDVAREAGLEPILSSSKYQIDEKQFIITGVTNLNVTELKKGFSVENGSMKFTDAKGTELKTTVGTGSQIRVYNTKKELEQTYTIIIYGDTNGDGKVNALDLLRVQKDILNISKLTGSYQKAADTSKDGKVNALDLLQIQKHIIGVKEITQ